MSKVFPSAVFTALGVDRVKYWATWLGTKTHRSENAKMIGKTPDSHWEDLMLFLKHNKETSSLTDAQRRDDGLMMLIWSDKTGNVKNWASWERTCPELAKDRSAACIFKLIKQGALFWEKGQAHKGDLASENAKFNTNALKSVGADMKAFAFVCSALTAPKAAEILAKEWAPSIAIDDTCFNTHTASQRAFRKKELASKEEYKENWAEAKRKSKLGLINADGSIMQPAGELYTMSEIEAWAAKLHADTTEK